jgi:hypothetical protein
MGIAQQVGAKGCLRKASLRPHLLRSHQASQEMHQRKNNNHHSYGKSSNQTVQPA